METQLKEAVRARDIPRVRDLLIALIIRESGNINAIESITDVLESTPGIFEPDDGKNYPTSDKMTPAQTKQLIEDLKSNFSVEKFSLLAEIYELRKPGSVNPSASEAVSTSDEGERKPVSEAEREEMLADAKAVYGAGSKPKCNCGRVTGAVMMALGCAAAIVGICVPVNFLIGVGIGVFMLGSAWLYMNLPRK